MKWLPEGDRLLDITWDDEGKLPMSDKRLRMPTHAAQVLVKCQLDGQPCENVFYVQKQHQDPGPSAWGAVSFDEGAANSVAVKVKAWAQDHWAAFAHALAEVTEIDVIWNTVAPGGPLRGIVLQDSDFPIVGTNVGEPLPNNCTIAVEFRTGLLGRSYHGRQYAIGLNDGQIDSDAPNRLKASALTDVPAIWDALRSTLTDAVGESPPWDRFPLTVMSFVTAGSDRSVAVDTLVNTVTISDPYLDSMKRRLPGHNRHGRRSS